MAPGEARQRLLDAAIAYIAGHGITDVSLRGLAAEIGTSHRMLIHHFGSKEELWVEIIREVERRQMVVFADLAPDSAAGFEQAMRTWWKHISDPSLWPNERLFFEVYGQALQRRPPTGALLDGIVESWLEPAAELGLAMGIPKNKTKAFARLGLAVSRGLLLDLLATEDRAGVDAAMDLWIRTMAAALLRGADAQA